MESLIVAVKEAMGNEFDPTQSQTTIPLALMTRQIKPLRFQAGLQATFSGCVEALRDNSATNDGVSFRTLAKVLACVPGLHEEARIAATCQLSIIDMEIFTKEIKDATEPGPDPVPDNGDAQDNPAEEEKSEQAAGSTEPKEVSDGTPDVVQNGVSKTLTNGETDAGTTPDPDPAAKENANAEPNEDDEDIDADQWGLTCNECSKAVSKWKQGALYLCYYCTELNLCEKCYDDKAARERGELPAHWRTLCPAGHRHIKAPVEGWKGVKAGVLRIGESKVPFRDWLAELETKKWPAAWERFWSEAAL
jgi:hypothetical protein